MSYNNRFPLLIHFSLLVFLLFFSSYLTDARSCVRQCGGIHIPYPFGIGMGCYLEKWYEIQCVNSTSGKLVPFLSTISKEVVNISLPDQLNYWSGPITYGSVRIKNPVTSKGCSNKGEEHGSLLNLAGTPFYVGYGNTLIAVGCNNTASLTNVEPSMVGCMSSCRAANRTASEDYFMTINCNTKSLMAGDSDTNRGCYANRIVDEGSCKASMPNGVQQVVGVKIDDNNARTECKVAFLTVHSYSLVNRQSPRELYATRYSTVELGWFVRTTNLSFINSLGCRNITGYKGTKFDNANPYNLQEYKNQSFDRTRSCACDYNVGLNYASCACNGGYRGNPYDQLGCQDIDECLEKDAYGEYLHCRDRPRSRCVNLQGMYVCVYPKPPVAAMGLGIGFGLLIFIGGLYWLYKFIKKQRTLNQKKKFFKRNGGLLLQQQLTSKEGKVEKTRVFSSRELEKATENFSLNRILGQGGQGTVYKGMLVDGSIVAVKKSKVVDEDKLEEFINEIVILSQINHRNIVKLLGCCLETDVPVLVYEFIPNGNLFEHLHNEFDDNTMATWDVRLRIAVDISGALSYLHSAASSPIYHRDVKSTNIMLDEKYRAKVSDFGTSRTVTVDHTHLTTIVSGTVGYTDPEYFQSSQFTDKSDVYSFGVVLVELITGEKSISFLRSQENRTLSTYFTLAMKENKLFDIIDTRIRDGCKLNQVTAEAKIARRCLNLKGKKRPSMREVSMELERIRSTLGDMEPHEYYSENEEEKEEEIMEVSIMVESCNNMAVTAPDSQYNVFASSSSCSDVEPLFPLHTQ